MRWYVAVCFDGVATLTDDQIAAMANTDPPDERHTLFGFGHDAETRQLSVNFCIAAAQAPEALSVAHELACDLFGAFLGGTSMCAAMVGTTPQILPGGSGNQYDEVGV